MREPLGHRRSELPFIVDKQPPAMHELALRLVAANRLAAASQGPETLVNEKLGSSLTRVAGANGVASLLRRALALAAADVPTLKKVTMNTAGEFEGLEHFGDPETTSRDAAATAITLHTLELLVTFIGEGLTRRLVHEACPETSSDEESRLK